MVLPNQEHAIIPTEKLQKYLLSDSHPIGRSKATFFKRLGFSASNLSEFDTAIREILQTQSVQQTLPTAYGTKYMVDGMLEGKAQQGRRIRTVWIIEAEGESPRLVTAYPIDAGAREDKR